ncbi:MAG: Membrane alanine aminopeptidase N, partial [uncultured Gemmatimonadetes bacterium]
AFAATRAASPGAAGDPADGPTAARTDEHRRRTDDARRIAGAGEGARGHPQRRALLARAGRHRARFGARQRDGGGAAPRKRRHGARLPRAVAGRGAGQWRGRGRFGVEERPPAHSRAAPARGEERGGRRVHHAHRGGGRAHHPRRRSQGRLRVPLHAPGAGRRQRALPLLRPAGPQGARHHAHHGTRRVEGARQRSARGARYKGGRGDVALRGDGADLHLPDRVRGGAVGDVGERRAHAVRPRHAPRGGGRGLAD